jgi:hypothetical protein
MLSHARPWLVRTGRPLPGCWRRCRRFLTRGTRAGCGTAWPGCWLRPGRGAVRPGRGAVRPGRGAVRPGRGAVRPGRGAVRPGRGAVRPGRGAGYGLPGNVPDLATFWRVLTAVDPAALDRVLGAWVASRLASRRRAGTRLVLAVSCRMLARVSPVCVTEASRRRDIGAPQCSTGSSCPPLVKGRRHQPGHASGKLLMLGAGGLRGLSPARSGHQTPEQQRQSPGVLGRCRRSDGQEAGVVAITESNRLRRPLRRQRAPTRPTT